MPRPIPALLTAALYTAALGAALLPSAAPALSVVPIPATPPKSTATPVSPVRPANTPLPEILPTPQPSTQPSQPSSSEIQPVTPAPTPAAPPSTTAPSSATVNVPSDPLYIVQWDMQLIGMTNTWTQFPAGQVGGPVTVAVLDTGYVASPELAGRVVNGYDFVSDPRRAGDGNGRDKDASGVGEFAYHGEIIANIIGAAHDARGMAGINPRAKIVHVRVAGEDGLIDPVDLVDGLRWAAGLSVAGVPANPNPARILNLSLYADFIPLTGCDPRIQKAIDEVTAKGALVVAGSANDGKDASGYSPAGCRNVLTVTSVTQSGIRPAYANWGKGVALAAPGGEPNHGIIASSISGVGGQRSPDGTSFAAPHVSGVASLLLSVRPKLTPAQLRDLLIRTATPFPSGRCDPDPQKSCGSGTLNAAAALRAALASAVGK